MQDFLKTYSVITNSAMGATVTSLPTNIVGNKVMICYTIQWTGTPTGTFSVQNSGDYQVAPDGTTVLNAGTWNTYTLSTTTSTGGAAGNGTIEVVTGAPWIRLVYTFSSGTGTLNAQVTGKAM